MKNQLEQEIIAYAKALARKFVDKCETGRARSRETYNECLVLLSKISQLEQIMENRVRGGEGDQKGSESK